MFIKPLSYARVEDSEVVIEVACKSVCVVRACVQEIHHLSVCFSRGEGVGGRVRDSGVGVMAGT